MLSDGQLLENMNQTLNLKIKQITIMTTLKANLTGKWSKHQLWVIEELKQGAELIFGDDWCSFESLLRLENGQCVRIKLKTFYKIDNAGLLKFKEERHYKRSVYILAVHNTDINAIRN
jgi:hypothetical protein